MQHNCINTLVTALNYFLTMIVIITVGKCTFMFMRMITFKNIISVIRTTWCSIGRWISGVIRIASIIVFCHNRLMSPPVIFKFFIKKSKYRKENNYTDNDRSEIQIVGQLQNQISRENRHSKRKSNWLNNSQKYFFKNRRIVFVNLIFKIISIVHRSILAIRYLIISKTSLVNQKIWSFQ